MSLVSEILEELWNTELNYKGWRVNFFGVPCFILKNKRSLQTTLYRLKKANYIESDGEGWYMTERGKKYYKSRIKFKTFGNPFKRSAPKDLLLIFDVPQEKNSHRDWLRRQLKEFDYIMVQRSVWVGPSPLPKEFLAYIKQIGIRGSVETFKLARGYNLK